MTPHRTDVETVGRVFLNAMESDSFVRYGLRRGTWDVSHDCDSPVSVTMWSRSTGSVSTALRGKVPPVMEVTLLTACRRCRVCLRKKARLWSYRAQAEVEASQRTWFVTLTLSPDNHFWIDSVCATRERDFWLMPQAKKFSAQAQVIGIEVTKWLKRVRKNSGCQFRYLLVVETHNSHRTSEEMRGRPHLHVLVHEFDGQPIRKDTLQAAWRLGHSNCKLVTTGQSAAWYVSKYITKAQDFRNRESLGYGNQSYQDMD